LAVSVGIIRSERSTWQFLHCARSAFSAGLWQYVHFNFKEACAS
jgi:hypothetical protein